MCKSEGKIFKDYVRMSETKAFIAALLEDIQKGNSPLGENKGLTSDMGIPISGLVHTIKGGKSNLQGTWIHPDLAVNLAQWLSPKFAVWVSRLVNKWRAGKIVEVPAVDTEWIETRNEGKIDRNNDTPVIQLFRFCLDARNKEYTLAKQSLKSVVTEY